MSFGPGLTFIVKRGDTTLAEGSNGKARVKAGNYAIKFDDNATFHNVRLQNAKGKTVKATKRKAKTTTRKKTNFRTSVPGTSKGTFKLKLRPGRYTLLCDPHRTLGMTVTLIVRK